MKYSDGLILNGQNYFFGEGERRDRDTTYLYMPLTSNGNDKTGHVASVENQGVTFGQYQGVDCAYFNGAYLRGYNIEKNFDSSNSTFLCWCYNTGVNFIDGKIIDMRTYGVQYVIGYDENQGYFYNYLEKVQGDGDTIFIGTQQQNERVLCYCTTNGSNAEIGTIDSAGTLRYTTTTNHQPVAASAYQYDICFGVNSGPQVQYRDYIGGLSAMYIDLTTWTREEIQAYYDKTKALYGIS